MGMLLRARLQGILYGNLVEKCYSLQQYKLRKIVPYFLAYMYIKSKSYSPSTNMWSCKLGIIN